MSKFYKWFEELFGKPTSTGNYGTFGYYAVIENSNIWAHYGHLDIFDRSRITLFVRYKELNEMEFPDLTAFINFLDKQLERM